MKKSVLASFIVTALLLVIITPRQSKFNYQYTVGSPWRYETLVSDMDFPVLKSEKELFAEKEEKASEVVDCYLFDESVADAVVSKVENKALASGIAPNIVSELVRDLKDCYSSGVVTSFEAGRSGDAADVVFVKRGMRVTEEPAQNIYTIQDLVDILIDSIYDDDVDSEIRSGVDSMALYGLIKPNMIFDEAATTSLHKDAVDYISPTKGMAFSGQLIVSKDEIVTPDIQRMLDSYKAEYEKAHGADLPSWQQAAISLSYAILLLCFTYVLIFVSDRKLLRDARKISLILTLLFISHASVVICGYYNLLWLFALPFAALIVYLFSFFSRQVAIMLYFPMLMPLLFVPEYGQTLFFCNIAAGFVILITSKWLNMGWMQFLNVVFIFVAMTISVLSASLSSQLADMEQMKKMLSLMAVNSLLVVVCYPFLFIFEKIFSQLSYSRLWLLSDTNNKLLTKLSRLAPGTFQHSLQVANLSEAAVKKIGGNAMLVKVAALYHDIGKMDNPLCFIENQTSGTEDKYHQGLTPEESARFIIRHVEDGVEIARKASLPSQIISFIKSHHGSTKTGFFYAQYCNNGGDPSNIAPFVYTSGVPATKEEAVLMMADSIEAASRSLKDYSKESISSLVDRIVDDKLDCHQFDAADISMKEIGAVRETFKTYLQQIYHARISYPKSAGK